MNQTGFTLCNSFNEHRQMMLSCQQECHHIHVYCKISVEDLTAISVTVQSLKNMSCLKTRQKC